LRLFVARAGTGGASEVVPGVFSRSPRSWTDDKMLMEEMLNNIIWTYTGERQTDIFLNCLVVCDSA